MIAIDKTRYDKLMQGDAELTAEEIIDGWHFCCEFDGLLIHPSWPEASCCRCCDYPEPPETKQ